MRVRTQREVCEAYGKKLDDRKFVSRKIASWEIKKVNWGYEFDSVAKCVAESVAKEEKMPQFEQLEQYEQLIKELREENEKLKQENKELFLETLWSSTSSDNELEANYEYLQKKFQRLKRWYELVIELTYKYAAKNMKISKEEYKEQLSDEINEVLNEEMWRLE